MTEEEWEELDNMKYNSDGVAIDRERFNELLEKTRSADEHPEWYESPCACILCCSYGD